MNVLHVSPSFFPAHVYGGPIESLYQLCWHAAHDGCEVRVLTTDANGVDSTLEVEKEREVKLAEGLHARYCQRLARHSVSLTLLRCLPSYIRWADVVHLTAVYSFPTIPTLTAARLYGKPVVWSPRGALQRWRGSSQLRAKAVWERICSSTSPRRVVLHVTSEEEAKESLEKLGAIETVIIPNGVEIPETVKHVDGDGTLRLVYLGRLDPKKGIENLLEAGTLLAQRFKRQWSLTIAGSGELQYSGSIRARIEELTLSRWVKMVGRVAGESKQRLLENADVVVLPSYTENFGMVVAEALAYEVPVIASKGTPWRRVEEIGCGLWVENGPDGLAKAIEQMSRMPLHLMGQRGREWMRKEFSWAQRAKKMVDVYSKLLEQPS